MQAQRYHNIVLGLKCLRRWKWVHQLCLPSPALRCYATTSRVLLSPSSSKTKNDVTSTIKLGDGITFQRLAVLEKSTEGGGEKNKKENHESTPPLAIVCGWLRASDRQLKSYLNWYHDRGIETLSYSSQISHVLRPETGIDLINKVLHIISHDIKPPQIIFHHFSTGGFLMGQTLRILGGGGGDANNAEERELRKLYKKTIVAKTKAQIYDSPPDIRGIPSGMATTFFPDPKNHNVGQKMMHNAIRLSLEGYLEATKNSAGIHYRGSSDAFHKNGVITAPALWYYSKSDPIANYRDCETVIEKWRSQNTHVEKCVWEESPHIQHARLDPERYFGTLEKFLIAADVNLKNNTILRNDTEVGRHG